MSIVISFFLIKSSNISQWILKIINYISRDFSIIFDANPHTGIMYRAPYFYGIYRKFRRNDCIWAQVQTWMAKPGLAKFNTGTKYSCTHVYLCDDRAGAHDGGAGGP